MPESGEPEDIINEVPLAPWPEGCGPYYEMIVLTESGRPPGGDVLAVCAGCGRESIDSKRRTLVMQPSMWRGAQVFFLATTLYVIVTDEIRRLLLEAGATNVSFEMGDAA